jgi:parallel beta-helix repeat protein
LLVAKVVVVGAVVAGSLFTGAPTGERRDGTSPAPKRAAKPTTRATPRVSKAAAVRCNRVAAPWGSKHGNGTNAHPVRGVFRLVKLLHAGQTGCLRGGVYRETELIVKRPRVTLRGAPGERAVWRGRIVLQGRRDRLIGLHLDGSWGPRCGWQNCGTLPSPTINAPDVVVALNDITSPDSGICVHPRAWGRLRPDRFHIIANRIHNCGRLPHTEHDHGIYVADGTAGEIRDNVIYDNADRGIQLYPNARGTIVTNNTVDGNGTGVVFSERSSWNRVRDNVFTNSVVRWNAETFNLSGPGNHFTGNCLHPGNRDHQYDEHGGVALPRIVKRHGNRRARDAVYAARMAGDYRIMPRSACAGKGAPAWVAARRW